MSHFIKQIGWVGLAIFLCFQALSCSPEVGSEAWCKQLKEVEKSKWTASEVGNYTKHCLFG